MQEIFDTESVHASRRLSAWRDIVCDVYTELDCRSDLGSAFTGSVVTSSLGELSCSHVRSTAQKVYRSPARISRARDQHVLVAFAEMGRGYVRQDGKELVIGPGEFTLYDTTRPYELHFEGEFRQIILKFPRDRVLQRLGGTERLTATGFSSVDPLEKLAFDFVKNAVEVSQKVSPEAGAALSNQIVDILALAWANRLSHDPRGSSSHRSALLTRLKSFIDEQLANPELTIDMAAHAMGISARYINSLLEAEQMSFSRYVLARRLEQCSKLLSQPALANIHVSEIALSWGFNDLAYFSRCFRDRYDMSPRDYRRRSVG